MNKLFLIPLLLLTSCTSAHIGRCAALQENLMSLEWKETRLLVAANTQGNTESFAYKVRRELYLIQSEIEDIKISLLKEGCKYE